MKRPSTALGALSALLLLFAACGPHAASSGSPAATATTSPASPAATPTPRALGTVCSNLATINQSLTQFATITAATPVGEVQTLQSTLTTAVNHLVVLLPSNEAPTLTEVQAASTQLATTLKSQPATATMGQTGVDVNHFKTQAAAVQGTVAQMASALNCPA
jgi:hypothetical protein